MLRKSKYTNLILIVLLTAFIWDCSALFGPSVRPGVQLHEAGDYAAALEYFESIIAEEKANAKVYRLAYESAFKAGKRITAAKYYNEALTAGFDVDSLNSLATDLWYERALMVMGKDQWKEAYKAAEMISNLAPDSNQDKFCRNVVAGKKKYDRGAHKGLWDAISDYHHAANADETSGLPYFLMGQARYKNNRTDYDAALDDYYTAIKLEPHGYFVPRAKADIKKIEAVKKKMQNFWGK